MAGWFLEEKILIICGHFRQFINHLRTFEKLLALLALSEGQNPIWFLNWRAKLVCCLYPRHVAISLIDDPSRNNSRALR